MATAIYRPYMYETFALSSEFGTGKPQCRILVPACLAGNPTPGGDEGEHY